MTRGKFIFLLCIVFAAAFLWGGGGALFSPNGLLASRLPQEWQPAPDGAWQKIYRLINFKAAVEARLDRKNYVRLQDIPLTLQQATIATEDSRFYQHFGIDIEGIIRASLVNLQLGTLEEGGSTITQQLAKNLFLTQEKTFARKFEEVLLALMFEARYSKNQILEMYLNTIYYGAGAYGIGPAAQTYFGKPPSALSLAESALLAGLPNAPSAYSPFTDFKAAKQRQAIVLAAMVRQGFISQETAREAKEAPLKLAKQP